MAAALLWAGCTEHTLAPADADLGEPADLAASTDAPAPADLDAGPVDASRARDTLLIPVIDPAQTALPLCEDPAITVHGLPGRPCAGMDNLCTRGVRTAAGCCSQAPRYTGTGCGVGLACNGGGVCQPATNPPWESNGTIGDQAWQDVLGVGGPSLLYTDTPGFLTLLNSTSLVEVHPDDGLKVDVSDVHIAHLRGAHREAVAVSAPATARRRGIFLRTAPPDAEVCVVRGDFDTMGPVSADCDSPGATRVRCPTGDADTVCDVFPRQGIRIIGDDLAFVFEIGTFGPQPPGTDVRHALTVDSLDHRWNPAALSARLTALVVAPTLGCSPAQCSIGQIGYKTCLGVLQKRVCTALGCWGGWGWVSTVPVEVCDGVDNDCNGTVDDGGSAALCDDHVGCTMDVCDGTPPTTPIMCRHNGYAPLCASSGSANAQSCILPRCVYPTAGGGTGTVGTSLTWPTAGNTVTPTAPGLDANSCYYLQRNDYCTNTWDSCDCNGPEVCAPWSNGVDGSGCQKMPRMLGAATAGNLTKYWPCERDGLYCTEALCCEGDVRCRDLEQQYPDVTARTNAFTTCGDRDGGVLGTVNVATTNIVSAWTGKAVRCSREEVLPTTCVDGNPCTSDACVEPPASGALGWARQCPWSSVSGQKPGCDADLPDGCSFQTCTRGGGTCTTDIYPSGPHGVCSGLVNEGCGKKACWSGACTTTNSTVGVTACSLTSSMTECGVGTCVGKVCSHTIDSTQCPLDDGLSCTVPYCGTDNTCHEELVGGYCLIAGFCIPAGTVAPTSECMICNGGYGYSPRPNGTTCVDHGFCREGGQCNNGSCIGTDINGCILP